MLKYIFKIIKRIFFACVLLYSFDLLVPSKVFIPVNLYTIGTVTIFHFYGLFFLMIMKFFM